MFLGLNYVLVCHTIDHATEISCRDRPWKVHDLFFLLLSVQCANLL